MPIFNEPELSQTTAILVYCTYHSECLVDIINDTMNSIILHLYEVLTTVRSQAYSAIVNTLNDIDITVMSSQEIIDCFLPKMAKIPPPPSMGSGKEFMKDIFDIGLVIERMVRDWSQLRSVFLFRFL